MAPARRPRAAAARAAPSRGRAPACGSADRWPRLARRAQVGIDLQRRVGAGDARRRQHVGGLDNAGDFTRRLMADEDRRRRPAVARSRAAPRPARDGPRPRAARRRMPRARRSPWPRTADPGPGRARTCPCTGSTGAAPVDAPPPPDVGRRERRRFFDVAAHHVLDEHRAIAGAHRVDVILQILADRDDDVRAEDGPSLHALRTPLQPSLWANRKLVSCCGRLECMS